MTSAVLRPAPKPPATGRITASLAMVGSAASWGVATVMSRDLLTGMTSSALLLIQLTASLMVLMTLSVRHAPRSVRTWSFAKAAGLGLLEPGLTYSFALVGLSMTTAGNASIVAAAEPLLIVLVNWVAFQRNPPRSLMACVAVSILGLLLVSGQAWSIGRTADLAGVALLLLGTLFAAVYVVLSSRVAAQFPPAILVAGQQAVGLLFALAAFCAVEACGFEHQDWRAVTPSQFGYAAVSGVVQYALAFWLYLIGLRRLDVNSAGLWLALVPVFGLVGAFAWLGEVPGAAALGGTMLILTAVAAHQRCHEAA